MNMRRNVLKKKKNSLTNKMSVNILTIQFNVMSVKTVLHFVSTL